MALLLVAVTAGLPQLRNNTVFAGLMGRDRDPASAYAGKDCCPQPPIQVVAWGADWCVFCKRNKPELLRLQETGRYVIMFIDYDTNKKLAKKFKVKALPTYFVVLDDNVVFRTTSLDELKTYKPPKKEKDNGNTKSSY